MMADENNTSEEVVAVDASGAAPEGEARRGRGGRGRGEGGGRGRRDSDCVFRGGRYRI